MRAPGTGSDPGGFEPDRALARLEELVLGLPYDRALPDLEFLLSRAQVPKEAMRRDDRFLKVLHEALVARPFGRLDEVRRTRTELELCTLEVEVLTDQLREFADDPRALGAVDARLAEVRARLAEIRDQL